MATTFTTPGVYVNEISTLPSSIVAVATAVPGFFGYTEKGPINSPVRITSMIEFQAAFGGAFKETYAARINADSTVELTSTADSPYTLFYHMQMFFANGGGPCHIISVGHYNYDSPAIDDDDFLDLSNPNIGIGAAEQVDEITLLVAPEVVALIDTESRAIYDAMLAQCNKLKDRFSVFDVKVSNFVTPNVTGDADDFRNDQVGANFLKYGAAYYPALDTILTHNYSDDDVKITDLRSSPQYNVQPNNRLSTIHNGVGSYMSFQVVATGTPVAPDTGDTVTVTIGGATAVFTCGTDFPVGTASNSNDIALAIVNAINNHPTLSLVARAQLKNLTPDTLYIVGRTASNSTSEPAVTLDNTFSMNDWTVPNTYGAPLLPSIPGVLLSQNTGFYTSIKNLLDARRLRLYPAATMVGIYAAVDNDRGVWKAPANVSVVNIVGPSFPITEEQQGYLNVDATSGKSIDAIRSFVGRGTLVWGARTLDGNSNEWRYVPVRRLFIFVEESTKKASEFVVFEPNDKNTWLRVKGMITNFLTDLWKSGALAGDKPEQAFFVRVGLGDTMTAQDILEGKMIVVIGLAAVRPAEFIILQFEHKLQEA
jgi:hypothetical protein